MPSVIIGPISGNPNQIISGNVWSGQGFPAPTGIRIRLHQESSGNVYIGFSGNMTVNSGGFVWSGGGLTDGFMLRPGEERFIPRGRLHTSGNVNLWANCDAGASGRARLYWEAE